jgi:hypothetical protein
MLHEIGKYMGIVRCVWSGLVPVGRSTRVGADLAEGGVEPRGWVGWDTRGWPFL